MTITALPAAPSRSSPSDFSTKADAFIAALPTFVTEANALATAMNLNDTTANSTTSLAIGTGAKSLTVNLAKSYQPGMSVKIARTASPSNWMHGDVTSYNAGTGALVVNVLDVLGSGTYTDWTITFSAPSLIAAAQILAIINPTASRIIGKKATGDAGELTAAETRTILGLATTDAAVFGGLNTASGNTASIATATPTTIFAASGNSMYIVFAYIASTGSANYTAYGFVLTEGTDARIAAGNGSLLTLTVSGLNVQVTQSSGGNAVVGWRAIKIV